MPDWIIEAGIRGAAVGGVLGAGSYLIYTILCSLRRFVRPATKATDRSRSDSEPNSLKYPPVSEPQRTKPAAQPSRPNRPEDVLLDYPRAKIAIEYRADIKRDWEEIRLLGEESAIAYLTDLDENPDLPAYKLWARMVHEYESRQVPFDNENTQEKYDVLGDAFGLEAQIKFREVRDVLGSAFDADDVFEKIYTEFNGKRPL